jgi:hypothetical protein
MKVNAQVIDNYEEFMEDYDRHIKDPGMYPKPEPSIRYRPYNFIVDVNPKTDETEILIFTSEPAIGDLVVIYDEEIIEQLDNIIEFNKV